MKKLIRPVILALSFILINIVSQAQHAGEPLEARSAKHCYTMEAMEKMIRDNPALVERWRVEGEKRFKAAKESSRAASIFRTEAHEIVIPVVFHLVDSSHRLNLVSDRDIIDQVEILNRDFNGKKAGFYKDLFPIEIAQRIANVPVKFVLARRTPSGAPTNGIERRIGATPDHVSMKSFAFGGLDAWDTEKYVNIWAGTFSGSEAGLLGIATFPFMTGEPQGVVVGLYTLGGNACRPYYPTYSEGATLSHELGHFFYLWHTFGDQFMCNDADFRLQSGWPLTGASLNDDTPPETGANNTKYGNPSQNFTDGCSNLPYGMMYQSFMNYYDDRALFGFSEGQKARIIETINVYRSGLLTSDGAVPPVALTDAFLVTVTPRGGCDQRQFIVNNTPLKATLRNAGTTMLNSITLTVAVDGGIAVPALFPLSLAPGRDTVLELPAINASAGSHTITVSATLPNGGPDALTYNDKVTSMVSIMQPAVVTTPYIESFNGGLPANWINHNPNGNSLNAWRWSGISGASGAGAAAFLNYDVRQPGSIDELITPPIALGTGDSALLSFKLAHAIYSNDVPDWDGLEVHVSNDGGYSYKMVYKKTGNFLKTINAPMESSGFSASPLQPELWREEHISLTPFIAPGSNVIIKFRNVNAYGNNTFLDDVKVMTLVRGTTMDVSPVALVNMPDYACNISAVTPSLTVKNNSAAIITSFTVSYKLNNDPLSVINWTGTLPAYGTVNIPFPSLPVNIGNHNFLVYTSGPNGVSDEERSNDTLRKVLTIIPEVNAPLKESFEGTTFPPEGWAVSNPDNGTTWSKTTTGVRRENLSDSSAAWMRNFTYPGSHKKDELITPIIKYSEVDSVFLTFDLSHVLYTYPNATPSPMDTLEVLLTKDCGASFVSIYKKWGVDLKTTGAANTNNTLEYLAGYFDHLWRKDSVNLLPFLGTSSAFQVMFRSTHNQPGNNLYLDNVNVFTKNVPAHMKAKGYQIQPNPFVNNMHIWFYKPALDVKYIHVYDATGRMVWTRSFSGITVNYIDVDLTGKPSGVYLVKIGYFDESRSTFDRVIKR